MNTRTSYQDPLLPLAGVAVAMLVPRTQEGALDLGQLGRHFGFLLQRGIRAFALNGATGEYTLKQESEFVQLAAFGGRGLGLRAA